MNSVVAAITGAVVGAAAVGVAGIAVMANKDSRKNVEKAIDNAKENVENMKEEAEDKFAEGQEKVNKVVAAVKNSTQDVVKAAK
jgi:uncharacterized membrane-anchored protein YhcB (DUF1043 family)